MSTKKKVTKKSAKKVVAKAAPKLFKGAKAKPMSEVTEEEKLTIKDLVDKGYQRSHISCMTGVSVPNIAKIVKA